MTTLSKANTSPIISKRREQVRREWSTTERQIRKITASLVQQQLYLRIVRRDRSMAD